MFKLQEFSIPSELWLLIQMGPHKDREKLWPGWVKKTERNPSLDLYNFIAVTLTSFSSHGLRPSDLVATSVEQWWTNPKVVGSIPTLVLVWAHFH